MRWPEADSRSFKPLAVAVHEISLVDVLERFLGDPGKDACVFVANAWLTAQADGEGFIRVIATNKVKVVRFENLEYGVGDVWIRSEAAGDKPPALRTIKCT